jgi:hypothetical protein
VIPAINSKGGAMVMPADKLKISLKYIGFERNSMFDGKDEATNKENLDATANIILFGLHYGLTPTTSLGVMLPYKQIEATAKLGPNDVAIDNSGIGDMALMVRHQILPMNASGFALAFDGGIKIPTGATDNGFKKAPAFALGLNTPLPTQMGTGGYEYMFGIGASQMIDESWRVDAHTMYTYRTLAQNDYDFGNEISLDLATTKAITKQINIGLEYNFKHNSQTDMGEDTNAGLRAMLPFKAFSGSAGYITPQVEFLPFAKPKLHVGVGVSFLAHYNTTEYQPLEKERLLVRVGYLF